MRIKQIRKNYKFVPESVDAVSAEIQRFLTELKAQKKNIIETRLSVEVILLDLMDKYGEKQSFTYAENNFLGKPYITITVEGEAFNPLEKDDDEEFGNWSSALIQNSDYTPAYSYDRGVNTIRINLSKKEVNPIIKLFVAIVAAVVFSLLRAIIPKETIEFIRTNLLDSLYNAFLGLMATIEIPLVFLSVSCESCNLGNNMRRPY